MADLDVLVTPTSADAGRADRRHGHAASTARRQLHRAVEPDRPARRWPFPCGFSSTGLPLSMQIVGKPFAEATVLQVGDAYQRAVDWQLRVPPIAQSQVGDA